VRPAATRIGPVRTCESAAGFRLQVAFRGALQDPGRRRDLGRGRLEDRGPALSGSERDGGASPVEAWNRVACGRALTVGELGGSVTLCGQFAE
jgi:hypothetical protein